VKVLLRVVLTVAVAFLGLEVGIKLAPSLASWTGGGSRGAVSGLPSPVSSAAQPDWGGGHLSVSDRSAAGAIDSVKIASGGEGPRTETFSGSASGVLLRQKSDSDYALTLAMRSPGTSGRTAVFDMPSSNRFRKELLPGDADAEAPATDIPLYPQSHCRMQVGRGTATFIGFYLTPDSIEAVRSFYVQALGKLGWERVAAGRAGFLETFNKRKEDRTVVLQLRKQDSVTTRIGLVATTSGGSDRGERK
jgi:hypothetical protein